MEMYFTVKGKFYEYLIKQSQKMFTL